MIAHKLHWDLFTCTRRREPFQTKLYRMWKISYKHTVTCLHLSLFCQFILGIETQLSNLSNKKMIVRIEQRSVASMIIYWLLFRMPPKLLNGLRHVIPSLHLFSAPFPNVNKHPQYQMIRVLPLIRIYGLAISLEYRADAATLSVLYNAIKMEQICWTRCTSHKKGRQLRKTNGHLFEVVCSLLWGSVKLWYDHSAPSLVDFFHRIPRLLLMM